MLATELKSVKLDRLYFHWIALAPDDMDCGPISHVTYIQKYVGPVLSLSKLPY